MILWVFRGQKRQNHSSFVQEAATVDFQEVPDVTVEKLNIEHNWCSDFFFGTERVALKHTAVTVLHQQTPVCTH